MTPVRERLIVLYLLLLLLLSAPSSGIPWGVGIAEAELAAPGNLHATSDVSSGRSAPVPSGGTTQEEYARGVAKKGSLVVISKELAEKVRENNAILLSTVAIKARLDKNGGLWGYEAVQIDKGSIVERLGFRPHDLVVSVNAIPARDLEANRESLDSADRFEVALVRKGKTIRLRFEIR